MLKVANVAMNHSGRRVVGNVAYISINGHLIRSNAKNGTSKPPIRIAKTRSDRKPLYASEVEITGPCRLIYKPHNTLLHCGARLVLEVKLEDITIIR